VAAYSGQTVIFGGLIQKTRANVSRRVPFIADIPLLGYFFKYDQEVEGRTELLVIMTPMLVTGEQDLEYVKQVESSRMSWCLADVVEAHGDVGLSGGYGLWGPAVGNTIFPDLQPTVEYGLPRDPFPTNGAVDRGDSSLNGSGAATPYQRRPIVDPVGPPSTGSSSQPQYRSSVREVFPSSSDLPSNLDRSSVQRPGLPGQAASNALPQPVIVPQISNLPTNRTGAAPLKQSAFPVSAKPPLAARLAGWIDPQSQQNAGVNASNSGPRPSPIRLGSNDQMLTSD
jgi:hypothetical protein